VGQDLRNTCKGHLVQYQECEDLPPCNSTCANIKWGRWSQCSKSCGLGVSVRTRLKQYFLASAALATKTFTQVAQDGGCSMKETVGCNQRACTEALHCVISQWGSWSTCSATCGANSGERIRERRILHPGKLCVMPLTEAKQCKSKFDICPIDCTLSEWSDWTSCPSACDHAEETSTRTRSVVTKMADGGKPCLEPTFESKSCALEECTGECETSNWSAWSNCMGFCGPDCWKSCALPGPDQRHTPPSGFRSKHRNIIEQVRGNRFGCPKTEWTENCDLPYCPEHCVPGDWGPWSSCSRSCGVGSKRRSRKVAPSADLLKIQQIFATSLFDTRATHKNNPNLDADHDCSSMTTQTTPCSESAHCSTLQSKCPYGDWASWGTCTGLCGAQQTQTRPRNISVVTKIPAGLSVAKCAGLHLQERNCTRPICAAPVTLFGSRLIEDPDGGGGELVDGERVGA
jgi:hypothetical protein